MATETIQEITTVRGRVDRPRGLISGVKILGLESKNGRTYLPEAIRQAAGLYEGKRVNVDHGRQGESRSYADRIGTLTNVEARSDGLFGDLKVNPRHALAEQLFWDAEHAPENVGLSHDVSGKITRQNGKAVVEAINTVRSVDLVADPATTAGLFESLDSGDRKDRLPEMTPSQRADGWRDNPSGSTGQAAGRVDDWRPRTQIGDPDSSPSHG